MSRATASNDKYTMAFGVDHTPMGCFVQIWEKAAEGENPELDDMECPQIDIDELYGLKVHNQKTLERNPKLALVITDPKLLDITLAMRGEEFVVKIGKALDLDITKKVYELWD